MRYKPFFQRKSFLKYVILSTLLSCSPENNILGLLVSEEERKSFEIALELGKAAYDRNDLEKAQKYSTAAYELNPRSEAASILFGNVMVSLAGIGPFDLARSLVSEEAKGESSPDEAGTADQDSENEGGDGVNSLLSLLSSNLGLSQDAINGLGDLDTADPFLPILVPKCAEEARGLLPALVYLNQAINAVCPFVNPAARLSDDFRHNCTSTEFDRNSPGEAHFLWALSHLTESLIFNAVLTFSNDKDGEKSNLEKRADKFQTLPSDSPEDIEALIEGIENLESIFNRVLPVSPICSEEYPTTQLKAVLNDLLAVGLGFDQMQGLPPSIIEKLDSSLEQIRNTGSGSQETSDQLATLKQDLTKKVRRSLNQKLESVAAQNPDLSIGEKESLCDAFDSITGGQADAERPSFCSNL